MQGHGEKLLPSCFLYRCGWGMPPNESTLHKGVENFRVPTYYLLGKQGAHN